MKLLVCYSQSLSKISEKRKLNICQSKSNYLNSKTANSVMNELNQNSQALNQVDYLKVSDHKKSQELQEVSPHQLLLEHLLQSQQVHFDNSKYEIWNETVKSLQNTLKILIFKSWQVKLIQGSKNLEKKIENSCMS